VTEPDALAKADAAATDLLRLYEALGVPAVLLTLTESALIVRCQSADDVVPMCRRVVKEHEAPDGRTLN
jgi:hypothetical protein